MTASSLPDCVRFHDTELSIVDRNGAPWLTSVDLARALEFAKPDAVTRLYNRAKDEFDASMTETVTVTVSGNLRVKRRIFSPRGCHLIAMLAHTHRAKEFRRWVLNVLEGLQQQAPHSDDVSGFRNYSDQIAGLKRDIIREVTTQLAPVPADDTRLPAHHAYFVIKGRRVVVDTRDGNPKRGERAVVIRCEGGSGPEVATILGDSPTSTWFDRCKIYDSGVRCLIPVGVVIGRVVWEEGQA